ncbi:MAG TPA: hypothetical protein VFQ47_04660 [Nitrososphaera sp.]|jgi:hypothetical protein|nr:hypothetical protein [Nitrososphaera sp.]
MKKVTFLIFVFLACLLTPEKLFACQCIAPVLDTEEDFRVAVSTSLNRADAVFSGEVAEMDRFTIKFKVQEVWKGDFKEEVTLGTGAYIGVGGLVVSSRCGPLFEVGKTYLVFARGPEGESQAERCSWTGILSDAERVVWELDGLRRIGTILWLSKASTIMAKSNNSLNRSANSIAFMCEACPF